MLNKEEAREIALVTIAESARKTGYDLIIMEKAIVEKEFAWVFPFNTREYIETGNIKKMTVGNGPVVVNRRTGAVVVAPPMPIEHFLAQYEADLNASN
ncbi:MAG: hypothetical protein H7Z75_12385 [Ferruginibacter sp.]|nr:hypothetical protein [Cytophagales bacterium]